MRRLLVVALGLVVIAGIAGGAAAFAGTGDDGGTNGNVTVDASFDGKQVEISAGGILTVTLESNATTGFQWQLVGNSDGSVLELVGQEYVVPEAGEGLCGAGGQEVWTFKALGKGESEISMEYSQPWDGGIKGAGTFELTVTVD